MSYHEIHLDTKKASKMDLKQVLCIGLRRCAYDKIFVECLFHRALTIILSFLS